MQPAEGESVTAVTTSEAPVSQRAPAPGGSPPGVGRRGCLLVSLDLVVAWAID